MSTHAQLHSIASSLDTYRTQFAALGNALSALRAVSDQLIAQLDRDREALETHLQAAIALEGAVQPDADAAVPDLSDIAVSVLPVELQPATELPEEVASAPLAEAAEPPAETPVVAATENVAGSLDETTPIETEALTGEFVELETEVAAAASDASAPATGTTATTLAAETSSEAIAAPENAAGDNKVISLADHREANAASSPARRRARAFVASILVTAGATLGLHELLQSELGQRMLELGTCDGDMLSATRDCSLLAWLTI